MTEKVIRIRISEITLKRYKMVCLERNLSLPKQTLELIRKFVDIQEENNERLRQAKIKI